ncbi:MAG TPA: hypothetical protein PLF40_23095, partial [Kofleriaceae bacterium]|nr:hypothetical protein [Kofleriaceae bacterium]
SKPSSKPPARVRPVVAPQAFAAPSRRISTQLQALIDFALTAARDNRCSDAQSLAVHAAAIDATYVEATLANDAAMRRCAEPQAQR